VHVEKKSILAILAIWLWSYCGWSRECRLDATAPERQEKDARPNATGQSTRCGDGKSVWNATGWNQSPARARLQIAVFLEAASQSHPAVVLLGTSTSVVSRDSGSQYFPLLDNVQDRLLVNMTCDSGHLCHYRYQPGIDQLYSQFCRIAKASPSNKFEERKDLGSLHSNDFE